MFAAITAIIGAVVQAVSMVSQYKAAAQQAEAQKQQNVIAQSAMIDQYNQTEKEMNTQHQAENEADAHKQDQFNLEAARTMATAQVQSSASGAGGQNEAGLMRGIQRQNDRRSYDLKRTNHYANLQINNQMTAAGMRLRNSESSMPVPQKPSKGMLAFGLGSLAVSTLANSESSGGKESSMWSYFDTPSKGKK